MTTCPICLRPRGKREIAQAYTEMRLRNERQARRPLIVAACLGAAGVIASVVYYARAPILETWQSLGAPGPRASAAPTGPDDHLSRTEDLSSGQQAPETSLRSPTPFAVKTTPIRSAPAPIRTTPRRAAPQKDAPPKDQPLPSFDATTQWAVFGGVYDILSLRPIVGAQILFQSENGGTVGSATTDAEGRYVAVLPRMQAGSLIVASSDPRYASRILAEPDIPYKELTVTERLALAHSAWDGDLRPAAFSDVRGEASARRNLFLAPQR